jgi:hypothetical protein
MEWQQPLEMDYCMNYSLLAATAEDPSAEVALTIGIKQPIPLIHQLLLQVPSIGCCGGSVLARA